jgi:hypothetical protein
LNTVGGTVNASEASACGLELANPIATSPLGSADRWMLTRPPLSLIVPLDVDCSEVLGYQRAHELRHRLRRERLITALSRVP